MFSARKILHPARVLPKPLRRPSRNFTASGLPICRSITCASPRAGSSAPPKIPPAPPFACWENPPRSICWATVRPLENIVKVNDTWLEVVGVLDEQITSGSQNIGAHMQDLNNIVFIPLNTFQYRFWDVSSYMKDDLDGVDLRLKEGVDSVQVAKVAAAILNSTHHNIQDFTRHHSSGPAGPAEADPDHLHLRHGGHRGDFAAGGRHRNHEHRAFDGAGDGRARSESAGPLVRGAPISSASS